MLQNVTLFGLCICEYATEAKGEIKIVPHPTDKRKKKQKKSPSVLSGKRARFHKFTGIKVIIRYERPWAVTTTLC